jgi:hypothetical protein
MANKAVGEIDITLSGKQYTLRPGYKAILAFEDEAGMSVYESLVAAKERHSAPLRRVALLFQACITSALEDSGRKVRPPTVDAVAEAIVRDGISEHLPSYFTVLSNMITSESDLKRAAAGESTLPNE